MKKSGKIKELCCPNCAKHLAGITDEHGGVRLVCTRCGARLYSKPVHRKTNLIHITMP